MYPLKARELIKETAKELNLDLLLVDDIIQYYWEQVKKSLDSGVYCNIDVLNLGYFQVSKQKLSKELELVDGALKRLNEQKSFSHYKCKEEYVKRRNLYTKLMGFITNEEIKKLEIRRKRHESRTKKA